MIKSLNTTSTESILLNSTAKHPKFNHSFQRLEASNFYTISILTLGLDIVVQYTMVKLIK